VSPPLLSIKNLRAFYGRAQILFDLSLEVGVGEVVALMGRNGAGKSTTLKSIMGLLDETRGEILFRGKNIEGLQSFEVARLGLGYVPEERRIFTELSVLENLTVGMQPVRDDVPSWTVEKLFELFPNLGEMPDRLGGEMSGGEQQMLTVARTLMGNPHLVMLDEPSEGIAPKIVEDMAHMILTLKKEGLSVLLSEQNLRFAQLVSDRAYVMEKGQIRYAGDMSKIVADEEIRRGYLGV